MVEEKPQHEKTKEDKETVSTIRIWVVVITVLLIGGLIIVKTQVPSFPFAWVMVIGLGIIVFGIFAYAMVSTFRQEKRINAILDKKLPKPASLIELRTIAESALTNEIYGNHTTGCDGEKFVTLPKSMNKIYIYKTRKLYPDGVEKGIVYIIINAHYPSDFRTTLIDPTQYELNKAIASLGTTTEEEPTIKKVTTTNPTLGVQTTVEEPVEKTEEKPAEKKEDLE